MNLESILTHMNEHHTGELKALVSRYGGFQAKEAKLTNVSTDGLSILADGTEVFAPFPIFRQKRRPVPLSSVWRTHGSIRQSASRRRTSASTPRPPPTVSCFRGYEPLLFPEVLRETPDNLCGISASTIFASVRSWLFLHRFTVFHYFLRRL